MLLINCVAILVCINYYVTCDWVEIQQNTPKSVYKVQTAVYSFSDSPSLFLSSSNINKVYSYQTPLDVTPVSTTTTTTEMTKNIYKNQQKENLIKLHYPERFTTSVSPPIIVEIHDKLDDLPSTNAFTERIDLKPPEPTHIKKKNSTSMDLKVPVRVANPPLLVSVGKKLKSSEEDAEEDEEGVTIVDFDDDDDDYEDDPEDEEVEEYKEKVVEKVKTVPKRPKPTQKPKNTQRRVLKQKVEPKPKLDNSLNFTGFVKFLKSIQENFATKTARNINDKVRILRRFRDNLLLSIEERIRNLWKSKSKKRRTKRTLGGSGGGSGHDSNSMEFPSAEGALLSISFLTFSVFLIKLVLQVINTIKSKHYSWNNQYDMGAMQASNIVIKKYRNARKISFTDPKDVMELTKVLNAVENLQVK
ncbi:unnamed protein product [Diamesa serratosioi]